MYCGPSIPAPWSTRVSSANVFRKQSLAYTCDRRYTQSLEHKIQVLREFQNGGPSTDSSRADESTGRMSLGTTPLNVSPQFEHIRDQTLEGVRLSSATVVSLIEQYEMSYNLFARKILTAGQIFHQISSSFSNIIRHGRIHSGIRLGPTASMDCTSHSFKESR